MDYEEARAGSQGMNQTVGREADQERRRGTSPEESRDNLEKKNELLSQALMRASDELTKMKDSLAGMKEGELTEAVFVKIESSLFDARSRRQEARVLVSVGSRRLVVPVSADLDAARLEPGQRVYLNDRNLLVKATGVATEGQIYTVRQSLPGSRLVVADNAGNKMVVRRAHTLLDTQLDAEDTVLVDPTSRFALEAVEPTDGQELVLEEVPRVSFADIGGLERQVEEIKDAVELPFLHRALYERYGLKPPQGVLLYGPPCNGKTMIAKAIAHSLAQGFADEHEQTDPSAPGIPGARGVFLSVKGPELLSKYVGEAERIIREVFDRARERAASGVPVIVFIDEMDSLLRTRGSGVSSDMETTIVPQFLTELDGIDELNNVIVIGTSNRIDIIDPAVLRPGRLDVKIKVPRPELPQAKSILSRYLTADLPLEEGYKAENMIALLADEAYARSDSKHVCDIINTQGIASPVYFSDLISGAILRNIVDRVKTKAVKASLASEDKRATVAISREMIMDAVEEEYVETVDSVSQTTVEQWARVNGIAVGDIRRIEPSPHGRRTGSDRRARVADLEEELW